MSSLLVHEEWWRIPYLDLMVSDEYEFKNELKVKV